MLPQPSLDGNTNSRSSESIRASVFDVCMQLGALDDSSLVAEWMFNDPTIEGDSSLCRQNPITRFKEMFSSECLVDPDIEIPHARRHRRLLPFSLRAPTFTKHLSRPKSRLNTDEGSLRAAGSKRVAISRGCFFKRTINTPNTVVFDDGHVSTHHRTFFQRKPSIRVPSQADSLPDSKARSETHAVRNGTSSSDTTIHFIITKPQILDDPEASSVQDDADSNWEEIEAIPGSPLDPLSNEGMNPSAGFPPSTRSKRQSTRTVNSDLDAGIVHDAVCSKFLALRRVLFRRPLKQGHHSLSSQRRRDSSSLEFNDSSSPKKTSVKSSLTPRRTKVTKESHFRSRSDSLPPSPFVLLTSRDNDADSAMPTTQIVFSSETPPRPASRSAIEAQTSCGMGYHHQFFVQAQEEAFKTSLKSPVSPILPA